METPEPRFGMRAALLASLGTGVGLIVLAWVALASRTTVLIPERYLPSDETAALFTNVKTADIQPFTQFFPILSTLPELKDPAHIALLQLQNDEFGWVILPLDSQNTPQANGSVIRIRGSINILTSGQPELAALLERRQSQLEGYGAFASLARRIEPGKPWTYLNLSALQQNQTAAGTLAGLLKPALSMGLVQDSEAKHVLFYTGTAAKTDGILPGIDSTATRAVTAVHLRDLLNGTGTNGTDSPLLQSFFSTWNTGIFGSEISTRYDLLPLFNEPATIEFLPGVSGSPRFALYGVSQQSNMVHRFLARFWQGHSEGTASVRVLEGQGTGEKAFPFRAVIQGNAESGRTMEQNGWNVQETGDAAMGSFLGTAVQDGAYVLTNDPALLENHLQPPTASGTLALPSLESTRTAKMLAGGLTSAVDAQFLLPADYGNLIAFLFSDLQNAGSLRWSWSTDGPVRILSISK